MIIDRETDSKKISKRVIEEQMRVSIWENKFDIVKTQLDAKRLKTKAYKKET
jgi:hypothetical protein